MAQILKRVWSPIDPPSPAPSLAPPLEEVAYDGEAACDAAIATQLEQPIDLRRELGIRQRLVRDTRSGRARLVTQMHHALGDFVSLVQWLRCQLDPTHEPTDTRAKALRLTAAVRALTTRAVPAVETADAAFFASLGASRAGLNRNLRALIEAQTAGAPP